MNDYTKLDAAILAAIKDGINTCAKMDGKTALQNAAAPFISFYKPFFRVIDGRLQSLRKAGKIRFNKKTWELV